jgi:hypothetical protein
MISAEQFAHSDPADMYSQMRPDQWTAIANEFLRVLKVAGDPQGDHLANEFAPADQQITPTSVLKTRDQAVAIHLYTRDHYPDLFAEVARHPVTVASLQAPGAPAMAEESVEEKAFIVGPDTDTDTDTGNYMPEEPAYTAPAGYIMGEHLVGDAKPPHKGEHLSGRDEWGEPSI